MKVKVIFATITLSIITLFAVLVVTTFSNRIQDASISWVGEYNFEEYVPPNIGRIYSITIYEDDGLYAYIKVDGFQTLLRLKAKVVDNEDEILFEFIDYYDEYGLNTSTLNKGAKLLRLQIQDSKLVTLWEKIQPVVSENEETGVYFKKVNN